MGPLGAQEMVVIFLVALVLFGPKKLPELGRTIGRAITEFRRAQNELKATLQHHMVELEKESDSIREITRSFNNEIYNNYFDSRSYDSHGNGSPSSWESAGAFTPSQPAIEAPTTDASAPQDVQPESPNGAGEVHLAVNGTVPRGTPAPVEPEAHSPAVSPTES
ncbi:MAG TPA: twin-arginine translocase TatA/TatE family subunit [Bryobacteraceae bacterium]|nr:twin-arginine translocase TatA/TatE family subunit [Bryobacteraceae bacterium]